jgi:hypothetical protein
MTSLQVTSDQVTSLQETSDQLTADHDAALQAASDQVTAFQAGFALAAAAQPVPSKTGAVPPSGSGTTNLSSPRFGFGGLFSAAALKALISPTPADPGGASGM